MAIWRFNLDGTPDVTFGNDGVVTYRNASVGNSRDEGHAIALDTKGGILVTGTSFNRANRLKMAIWRYDGDGVLDESFGIGGIAVHSGTVALYTTDTGESIVVDSSGRILVAGTSEITTDGYSVMAIWRYKPDGTIDWGFGSGGVVVFDGATVQRARCEGKAIALDSSGRILVAGSSLSVNSWDMAIWRYEGDGILDESFGDGGMVFHNNAAGGNSWDIGESIVIDSSGRILVTGKSDNSRKNPDMVIWRYNPDGTLDEGFGQGGVSTAAAAASLEQSPPCQRSS